MAWDQSGSGGAGEELLDSGIFFEYRTQSISGQRKRDSTGDSYF